MKQQDKRKAPENLEITTLGKWFEEYFKPENKKVSSYIGVGIAPGLYNGDKELDTQFLSIYKKWMTENLSPMMQATIKDEITNLIKKNDDKKNRLTLAFEVSIKDAIKFFKSLLLSQEGMKAKLTKETIDGLNNILKYLTGKKFNPDLKANKGGKKSPALLIEALEIEADRYEKLIQRLQESRTKDGKLLLIPNDPDMPAEILNQRKNANDEKNILFKWNTQADGWAKYLAALTLTLSKANLFKKEYSRSVLANIYSKTFNISSIHASSLSPSKVLAKEAELPYMKPFSFILRKAY